jgi:hypothetical protein
MAARKPRFTRAQIKNHIKKIQEEMEKRRPERERRGERFVPITPEELEKKLKRANSPIIAGGSYTPTTAPVGRSPSLRIFITGPHRQLQSFRARLGWLWQYRSHGRHISTECGYALSPTDGAIELFWTDFVPRYRREPHLRLASADAY